MAEKRKYHQSRNFLDEAKKREKDYESIMGKAKTDYELLRKNGIITNAFPDTKTITVTRQCWNHVFKHPHKRPTRVEKIERAMVMSEAVKLIEKTTTYQEVSKEKDKGGNEYLFFGLIGYIRGNRIKVIIRKQLKNTNPKYVLFSFYQMSASPKSKKDEDKKA